MSFNINLADLIKQLTVLEASLGAVSRLRDFVVSTESEAKSRENQEPATSEGTISIKGFSAASSESSDLVLKGITPEIRPGEKLGIYGVEVVNSACLHQIFHLLEYREGFIAIDGKI